jgi:hypothetical protein
MKKECHHDFYMRMPYAPDSMDETYVHVTIEATCDKCGMEVISDYSWDVTEGSVVEEGDSGYECDNCGEDIVAVDESICDTSLDIHFCSQECKDELWGHDMKCMDDPSPPVGRSPPEQNTPPAHRGEEE